jgi:hypothetical protein
MDHDEQAERLEREADKLERESERIGGRIEDTRRDWDAKQSDQTIPGAQPGPEDEAEDEVPGPEPEGPGRRLPT